MEQPNNKPLKSAVELAMEKTEPKKEPVKPMPSQLDIAMKRSEEIIKRENINNTEIAGTDMPEQVFEKADANKVTPERLEPEGYASSVGRQESPVMAEVPITQNILEVTEEKQGFFKKLGGWLFGKSESEQIRDIVADSQSTHRNQPAQAEKQPDNVLPFRQPQRKERTDEVA